MSAIWRDLNWTALGGGRAFPSSDGLIRNTTNP